MLRLEELDYDLPESRIATSAVEPRDAARMLVVRRLLDSNSADATIEKHAQVRDLVEYLRAGDLLILNTSRVLAAWLGGHRVATGGRFHGLYLGPAPSDAVAKARPGCFACWTVMLRGGHLREGAVLKVERPGARSDAPGRAMAEAGIRLELIAKDENEPGAWHVAVFAEPGSNAESESLAALLDRVGSAPVPPYIRSARRHAGKPEEAGSDRERYQTVFARGEMERGGVGSVAAPTAGMHLTVPLLESLRAKGVATAEVVLHVGAGTFRQVETPVVEDHPIHSEWCSMPESTSAAILRTRRAGGRVVCVGTTSARVVEAYAQRDEMGLPREEWLETRILITPGYRWRWVDGMLTNFHLPRSTLMAMVGAMLDGGVARLKGIYGEAVGLEYRFFSFGDSMLVLPD